MKWNGSWLDRIEKRESIFFYELFLIIFIIVLFFVLDNLVFFIPIAILISIIMYCISLNRKENDGNQTLSSTSFEPNYAMEVIQNEIPNFNRETFLIEISQIYEMFQKAYIEFDYGRLGRIADENLYNTYKIELEKMKNSNEKNVIADYKLNFIGIADAYMEDENLIVKIKVNVSKKDYRLNTINQEIIEGCKHVRDFSYDLFFKYSYEEWILVNIEYIKQESEL